MSQYGYQPGVVPSAPPLLGPSADDEMAPPSYDEAIAAPPGGSFSNLSRLNAAGADVPSFSAGPASRTDPEAGQAAPAPDPPPAVVTGGTGDDPPSYQSLFGQIKDAKQSSSGICDFITKLFLMPLGCLIGLVAMAVILGLVFGLPISLVTVGAMYMNDCPVAPGIPIWMVVGGVVLITYITWVSCTSEECSNFQSIVGVIFYLAWYISGCVFVYPAWHNSTYWPSFEGDTEYCDYTPMMTAFITINVLSVLTGLLCCLTAS